MNAESLMDSVKFRMLMDDLARAWKKRTTTDEERAYRLQQLLDCLPSVKGAVGKALETGIAPDGPLKPEEVNTYTALADQAARDAPNIPEKMARLMAQYVLPAVRKGQMAVRIPETFEGRPLPSSNKVWLAALAAAGIAREEVEWGTSADGLPVGAAPMSSFRVLKLG